MVCSTTNMRRVPVRLLVGRYEQVLIELDEASNADIDALTAVCAYRCTSLEECRIKAEYLLSVTGGRFTELLQHDSEALLWSFLPEGIAAAA